MSMHAQTRSLDAQVVKRVSLRYLLWLPAGYSEATQQWPLILFLHGRGERGDDLATLTREGLPGRLRQGFDLPALAVAPQCPGDSDWTMQDDALLALLDEVAEESAVDTRRVYLTGLSMGARGGWRLAAANPHRFAALALICGRRPDGVRSPEDALPLRDIPVWVFHGALDKVVPIEESDAMVAALREHHADERYTVYPDAGHDAWTPAYAEPELYTWMLTQQREGG